MYSFAQRPNTRVIDEPLYGHYLRVTGAPHPGREDVTAQMNCDGNDVLRAIGRIDHAGTELLFIKHMAHHLVELDLSFLNDCLNALLIRDPQQMLPSLTIQLPGAGLEDTGLKMQWELYESLCARGQRPAILDARELLLDPRAVLNRFCEHFGLAFTDSMLHWERGPIAEDGVWAPHWYHAVHRSTGFSKYQHKESFPDALRPLLDECMPWYEKLFAHAIRATA